MNVRNTYLGKINRWLKHDKVLIIYGARQVGKTTILRILKEKYDDVLLLNCEKNSVADVLSSKDISRVKFLFGSNKIVALDEAQKIPDLGLILKLLHDDDDFNYKIIATGSSSFELANQVTEPLTGRNIKIQVYPYSLEELVQIKGTTWLSQNINDIVLYGSYPEIVDAEPRDKVELLQNLTGDYLYQDILQHEQLKNSNDLNKLLRALAYQLGSEVSYNELGNMLGLSSKTIERYIDLLVKNFVLIQIPSYSRNLRNELRKSKKIYFVDTGLRNALVNDFSPMDFRLDKGGIWENFCVLERLKTHSLHSLQRNIFFWRTYDQAEIDLIEEYDGALDIFEFKYKIKRKTRFPKSFMEAYEVRKATLIDKDRFYLLTEP